MAVLSFFSIMRQRASMLPDSILPWLSLLFAGGVALQAASLRCGVGAGYALRGSALVCLYAAQERDITFAIG
jgi:hypothetical protein